MAATEMRRRLERNDDDAPRQLPTAEREARREVLQRPLTGLDMTGELDPAPSRFSQQSSRRASKSLGWAPDSSGVVKETAQTVAPTVTITTTHHLSNALIRRGLAMDMGGVMTFEVHECIRRVL